jgi:hypothetical protein
MTGLYGMRHQKCESRCDITWVASAAHFAQGSPPVCRALIINTMGDAMSQGIDIDIQLRILQTLVSLMMNFPSVNGGLLGEVGFYAPTLHKT